MKNLKLQLTLDVEFSISNTTNPQDLKQNLSRIVSDAIYNGIITGETSAEISHYYYEVRDQS